MVHKINLIGACHAGTITKEEPEGHKKSWKPFDGLSNSSFVVMIYRSVFSTSISATVSLEQSCMDVSPTKSAITIAAMTVVTITTTVVAVVVRGICLLRNHGLLFRLQSYYKSFISGSCQSCFYAKLQNYTSATQHFCVAEVDVMFYLRLFGSLYRYCQPDFVCICMKSSNLIGVKKADWFTIRLGLMHYFLGTNA